MNPLFKRLYKHKKTRVRDPNAPPPPTLLGQVKELKDTRNIVDQNADQLRRMEERIVRLEARNRYLENYVDSVRNYVVRVSKK